MYSLTYKGLITYGISWLFKLAGVEVPDLEPLFSAVFVVGQIVAVVQIVWGRFRKGDLTILGFRKS